MFCPRSVRPPVGETAWILGLIGIVRHSFANSLRRNVMQTCISGRPVMPRTILSLQSCTVQLYCNVLYVPCSSYSNTQKPTSVNRQYFTVRRHVCTRTCRNIVLWLRFHTFDSVIAHQSVMLTRHKLIFLVSYFLTTCKPCFLL